MPQQKAPQMGLRKPWSYLSVYESKPSYRFQPAALLTTLDCGIDVHSKSQFLRSYPGLDCFYRPGQLFCRPRRCSGNDGAGCHNTGQCLRPSTLHNIGTDTPGTRPAHFQRAKSSHIRMSYVRSDFGCSGAGPDHNLSANIRCTPATCL
jgi:hypothetical protein